MRRAIGFLAILSACSGNDTKVGVYNTPPSVSITSPPDGSSFDEGTTITFEAIVDDDFTDPADMTLSWATDRDGALQGALPADGSGLITYSTAGLSVGNHVVSLQVVDTEGESASDSVSVTVDEVADNPTITVVHPASGETGTEGEGFEVVVQVTDNQDDPTALVVTVDSDVDGEICAPTPDVLGVAKCDDVLFSGGDHVLTFTVADSSGLTAEAVVYFAVISYDDQDLDNDGWTANQGDCDDNDGSVKPGATEYCNERDDDCDDIIDEETACYDDDSDGLSELEGDCDDTNDEIKPGGSEVYNSEDDDCDGYVDEGTEGYDDDGDGYTEIAGDCDDSSGSARPGGTETADGLDNDCDGTVDEGTTGYDDDGDGYSEDAGDCNDADSTVSPRATEACGDGIDNDCDDSADEENASGCNTYYYDYDGDAYGSSAVSGRCLCSTDGYYSSRYNTDCYDYSASANPAATSYYTTHRGDSSYDYNCDSASTQYYTATYDCSSWPGCSTDSTGWRSGVASCGSSASWVTDCDTDWTSCSLDTTTVTQSCR